MSQRLFSRLHRALAKNVPQTDSAPGQPAETGVARCWGETAARREQMSMLGWLDSPVVRDHYVLPNIAQGPSLGDAMLDLAREFSIGGGCWLSLGCGSAGSEISYAQQGLFERMHAYDISAEAIGIAGRNARAKGVSNIEFGVGDFDHLELAAARYDAAVMIMSLHHVRDLDGLLGQLAGALKPGGWLVVNEYVGPSQFQFGERQMRMVEDLLAVLPERLKRDYVENRTKTRYIVRPRSFWNERDPSEAVCSDQIPAALCRHFTLVARRDYGGTLLNPLLEHIVANFDQDRPEDVALLRLLAYLEGTLIREGVFASDFAMFVMRNQG